MDLFRQKLFILSFLFFTNGVFAQGSESFVDEFNKGISAFKDSDYEDANLFLQKAISKFTPSEDSLILGECYLTLGLLNGKLDNYEKSEDYILSAKSLFEQLQNDLFLLRTYIVLGNLATVKNQHEDALNIYQSALNIALAQNNVESQVSILNNIGVLNYNNKKYNEAIHYYQKALAISQRENDDFGISMCQINIGISYAGLKHYSKAIDYITAGIPKAEAVKELYYLQIGHEELAEIYHNIGRFDKAYQHLTLFMLYKDSLGSTEINKRIAELEATYNSQRKELEILELKKEKYQSEIIDMENKSRISFLKVSIGAISIIFLIMLLMSFLLFKQYKSKLVLNNKLSINKNDLEQKNEALENSLKLNKKLQIALRQDLDNYKQLAYRKQMNPHFIFNSLNSIQNYILTKDKFKANLYLGKLSTLIRRILENSEKDVISLKEELLVCETYISLEQERFDNIFDYKIFCDEKIETDKIFIPPLLLQPFIENAIWHGLLHKPQNAFLHIKIAAKEPRITLISIKDNGVGRKQKKLNPNTNSAKEQSMGINLTLKRIDGSNHLNEGNISLEIIDLYDSQKKPAGTEVVLTIEN